MSSYWSYFALALAVMVGLALMFITISLAFTVAVWLGWIAVTIWAVAYAAVIAGAMAS